MRQARMFRTLIAVTSGIALFVGGIVTAGLLLQPASGAERSSPLPGFRPVVFLSHVNDPQATPLFPGDPKFLIHTAFTVPDDGFYLEVVHEGTRTRSAYRLFLHEPDT